MTRLQTAWAVAMWSVAAGPGPAAAQYGAWKHSGSVFLLTTPEGANLPAPAPAAVEGFPVLVRLHKDFFDFGRAKPNGDDLRISSPAGEALAFQIERWDAANGTAEIWVRVPRIVGNARQELRLHWGKADAAAASDGKAVFNASNGYVGVWHMNGPVKDAVGTVESKDTGTASTPGVVGGARHFPGRAGVFCGDAITAYPSGAGSHSTEAWVRAERPNVTLVAWGTEPGGRGSKVRMQLRSPPHLRIDSNFSDVRGEGRVPLGEWVHVAHTYDRGDGRVYVNGKLDGAAKPLLNIRTPARLWLGGWYNDYDFVGDMDEVRISSVARSADWLKLQYENQKPHQTFVGPVVQPGAEFSVDPKRVDVAEGKSVTLSARAGGAQKVYWVLKQDGRESVAAVDRFNYTFDAGRVVGDKSLTLLFKAVYPDGVKTEEVPVTVREAVPEPAFVLRAPAAWDGRRPIEVVPVFANMGDMKARGAGDVQYTWTVTGVAAVKDVMPGRLVLRRALNSGPLTVTLSASNGGAAVVSSRVIAVAEPARDAWVERVPAKDETPEDGQFYARNDKGEGTLHYNGTLAEPAEAVFLRLYADEKLVAAETRKPAADKSFAFAVKLKPGLVKYKVEFGAGAGGAERVLRTVSNIVCGDVFLINGQSNAVATDVGKEDPPYTSDWVRTYGSPAGDPNGARLKLWGNAVVRSRKGGQLQIGFWGMELAKRLVENHRVPVCILNGAVGGTRIDQHQRNPEDPTDPETIYGRLLWRVQQAKLTHGVRGVLWHQGENDQGADGPTGGFGYETYRQYFADLAAAWQYDYPNVRHSYAFQIWPKSCAMGIDGSDNRLREVQRTLPSLSSKLSVMSTLGISPPGGCHFPPDGYAQFAALIGPLVERDHYGAHYKQSITAPNLKAAFGTEKGDELALEFDQPVKWDAALAGQFTLDAAKGRVVAGAVSGNTLTLKLAPGTAAKTVSYLDSAAWGQDRLLRGANGIAALTFCEVPIAPRKP